MASIFSTPSIYSNHENTGGAFKKRGTVSERKAFQDRNVNQKKQQQLKKPILLLNKTLAKDYVTPKPKIDEEAEWMFKMTTMPVTPVFKENVPSSEDRFNAHQSFAEPAMPVNQFDMFLPPKTQPLVFNDDLTDESSWDEIFIPKMPTPIDDFNF